MWQLCLSCEFWATGSELLRLPMVFWGHVQVQLVNLAVTNGYYWGYKGKWQQSALHKLYQCRLPIAQDFRRGNWGPGKGSELCKVSQWVMVEMLLETMNMLFSQDPCSFPLPSLYFSFSWLSIPLVDFLLIINMITTNESRKWRWGGENQQTELFILRSLEERTGGNQLLHIMCYGGLPWWSSG